MRSRHRKTLLLSGILVFVVSVAIGGSDADWTKAAVEHRFPDPDRQARAKDFVGAAECATCHEERQKSLKTSFHAGLLSDAKSRGCEECHGPGERHSTDGDEATIRNPARVDAVTSAGVCLRCHEQVLTRPHRDHREWIRDGKVTRSCVQCHRVHVDRNSAAFDAKIGPFRGIADLARHATDVPTAKCRECHPRTHPDVARSGHARLLGERKGCGACHGPGSLHVESGGKPSKIVQPWRQKQEDRNRTCLECHGDGQAPADPICRAHDANRISCLSCHRVNAPSGKTIRGREALLCGMCHADVADRFDLASRHPIEKGEIGCTDCHNLKMKAASGAGTAARREACIGCHTSFRGPFRHDHGIAKPGGCVACHDPHGSKHPRLLKRAPGREQCSSCHERPPHDPAEKKWVNCTSCHAKIHGSDRDPLFRR
jgi:DmsE family decaheme c-type cytochrome